MKNWTANLLLMVKGMAMGVAEVIPGVSGGTIAFITGIYERLINTIRKVIGPESWRALFRGGIRDFWREADGPFLTFLLGGMALGVVTGVLVVTRLLETYPVLVWAFFFGLIIASAIYIGRQVEQWKTGELAALVLGAVIAFGITVANPGQGTDALWFVFISGAIAISALILPGISGSFILLLLGMYTLIIPSVKDALKTFDLASLKILVVFGLGCLVGLGTFARLLSWTFRKYHSLTLALLTGFMIGSLNKIWPWRNVLEYRINSKGEEVPFIERSVLPGQFAGEPMVGWALLALVVGFASVLVIERLGKEKDHE